MRVARYTKDIQYKIGCRVDAEPWMHIVFEKFNPTSNSKDNSVAFAVYVWDTRKVLGTGFTRPENYELGASAKDNHKPLQGGDRIVDIIGCNDAWDNKKASKTNKT